MSTAWLFGGHGTQYVGMGREVLHQTAAGRAWLQAAEGASGLPLGQLARQGPARALTDPRVLEPLLAAASGAHADLQRASSGPPDAVAGYSAGVLAACYAAGAVDRATCLTIAMIRGEALARTAAVRRGGMLSAHGLSEERLMAIAVGACGHGAEESVTVAAHNAPMHVVYAGSASALQRASALARAAGAQTAALEVAGPWHTPWLEPAAQEIAAAVAELPMGVPDVDVWCGLGTRAIREPAVLREALAASVASPVRWHATVQAMRAGGVDAFVEVSPGRALWALLGQLPPPHGFSRRYVESPAGALRRQMAAAGHRHTESPRAVARGSFGLLPVEQAPA